MSRVSGLRSLLKSWPDIFLPAAHRFSSIVYAACKMHAHTKIAGGLLSSRTQGATIKNLEKFSILYFSIYNNIDELAS